ncbi:2-isopropylmalate synthase [Posidoniimonas polymericola]|uniref:2-isopropylmalate synthase n=1 Tax=Posidoniimonas polymericola TaxID=2528002 RepID=A0A5C5XYH0_9BACT|nr:2-isopropylmalate synthase [Posidoniimonas polymericola]TWT66985.1 2-isopropylmalate synthase [Posidoniimonas polymericola]
MRNITIFDTTLRDGEQSPGASMNLAEKLEVAQALVDLKVDVIEAGFPIASPGDFEAVRAIAGAVKGVQVCGLARCNPKDIDRAWEALQGAENPRIHVFLATSAIHREFKLKMDKAEIIRRAVEGVERAKGYCPNIEFSPEDAARTEVDFLCEVVEAAIAAGATTVNIPDTVGYATPTHMGGVIRTLRERVPNIDQAVISVHCHNDLGMAVANSLAAVENGAGQVECTINGIGERAGNCSLEEIVMALRTRGDYYKADTRIHTPRLVPTSRLVSSITGLEVQRNKAIVGRNAFAHEAGIHQDGMLKERSTYEIMRPEDVGVSKTDLVLGKHSGRAALADRATALGYAIEGKELDDVFEAFKKLADKKKEIYDADIAALIDKRTSAGDDQWVLASYEVKMTKDQVPSATVTLKRGEETFADTFFGGDGPLDALFRVVEKITDLSVTVRDYAVHSVSQGKDAQGESTIEVEHEGKIYRGRGVSTDTVEASTLAFINAMNRVAAGGGQDLSEYRPGAV